MSHVTRTWQVENTWNCPSCSAINRGRDLDCQRCGARKGAQVEDQLSGSDAHAVTDPELLRKATAGPNWACEYCGGQERNSHGECAHCGGPKIRASSTRAPAQDPLPIWKRRLIGSIAGWHLGLILAIRRSVQGRGRHLRLRAEVAERLQALQCRGCLDPQGREGAGSH
jgi:hypothetical protein